MALHFTINPMTGSGSNFQTRVEITPTGANTTHNDVQDNLRVNAGGSGHPLTLTHYGIPITRRTNGNGNIASGGGAAIYVVETHYDYYFEGIPDWITLSDDIGPIQLDNGSTGKILKEKATNNHYYFNVQANPSAQTRTTGHDITNFRNYRRNGEIDHNYHTTITITQDAGVPDAPVLNVDTPTLEWDWDASGQTKVITITSNISWNATLPQGAMYAIIGASTGTNNGTITIAPTDNNEYPSSDKIEAVLTIAGTGDNTGLTASVQLWQMREPFEELIGSEYADPTGDTKYITIKSDYSFWYKAGSSLAGTNGYSTEYITMNYNGVAVQPAPTAQAYAYSATPNGKTFDFVWLYNDAGPKNDCFIVQYQGKDGVIREMRKNFGRIHQDNIPLVEDYVIANPSAMTIDWWITSATNFTIETYSGQWSYDVQGDVNDFDFEKIGSQLKVSPKQQNTTSAIKNLSFSFSAGTSTATTTATTQQLRKPDISAQSPSTTIPSSGGTTDFYITSDYDWWIVDGFPAGIPTYSPSAGSNSNPNSPTTGTMITATFPQNTSGQDIPVIGTSYFRVYYNDRSGNLKTNGGVSTGWKQLAGTDELSVSQSRSFADISSGGVDSQYIVAYYLTISSPTAPWGITITPAEANNWVRFNPMTGGTTTRSIQAVLFVDANSGTSRSCQISVSAGTATPVLFNLSQQAAYVPPEVGYVDITPKSLSVSSGRSAGNQFEVSANTAWTITSPEWVIWSITPQGSSPINGGNGSKTIYAVVEENSGSTQRSGTAVFSSATNSVNVSISQSAGTPYVPPTPVGNLELDPAYISPASTATTWYQVECNNYTAENYQLNYQDSWAKFYDGNDLSSAEEVDMVESDFSQILWLRVEAGRNRSTTILFEGEDTGTIIGFYINQP